jgi:hypothetical protein
MSLSRKDLILKMWRRNYGTLKKIKKYQTLKQMI